VTRRNGIIQQTYLGLAKLSDFRAIQQYR